MALFLTIIKGPLAGDKYEVFEGLKLGRTKGHIKLNDSKSSTLHAMIGFVDGKFIIIDQGSKNGILVGKQRLTKVILEPGVAFSIGNNFFKVESDTERPIAEKITEKEAPKKPRKSEDRAPAPPQEAPPEVKRTSEVKPPVLKEQNPEIQEVTSFPQGDPLPIVEVSEPERRTWSEILVMWGEENAKNVVNKKKPIAAFPMAINLVFLRGVQAETTWTLGYGPRVAGPRSLDLPIYEPQAPDPCFEILPTATGIQFKTFHAGKVLLNGNSVEVKELKDGDQISILNSLIEVEFVK